MKKTKILALGLAALMGPGAGHGMQSRRER